MSTIIVSDIHLGSNSSRENEFLDFLYRLPMNCRRLIVNGDLWDSDSSSSLLSWKIYARLRQLSTMLSVSVLPGNHDPQAKSRAEFLGIPADWWAEIQEGGRKIMVCHGHQDPCCIGEWDRFLHGYPGPTRFANILEENIAFFGRIGRRIATQMHHCRKYLCNVRVQVRDKAIQFGVTWGYDTVICGHTHMPEEIWVGRGHGHPDYVNGGSWSESRCTYVEVDEYGISRLKEWKP